MPSKHVFKLIRGFYFLERFDPTTLWRNASFVGRSLDGDLSFVASCFQAWPRQPEVWNKHLWKHWDEWIQDYPWLQVEQTGLGCSICSAAALMSSSWSRFKACRNVSQLSFRRAWHLRPRSGGCISSSMRTPLPTGGLSLCSMAGLPTPS